VTAIGGLLVGVALAVFAWTNVEYRTDREDAFDVQQRELEAVRRQVDTLQEQLDCVRAESSHASQLEGDIAREGWLAMTIWASTGDSDHPRIGEAAARVAMLYDDMGPALIERREATSTCADG
jgi:hypothetical protein